MKASIHTAKESFLERKSRGKTAGLLRCSIGTVEAITNGKEVVSLKLTASRSRVTGTGERGGDFRAYDDALTLEFDSKDLNEILTAALENGLISVHFKPKSR